MSVFNKVWMQIVIQIIKHSPNWPDVMAARLVRGLRNGEETISECLSSLYGANYTGEMDISTDQPQAVERYYSTTSHKTNNP